MKFLGRKTTSICSIGLILKKDVIMQFWKLILKRKKSYTMICSFILRLIKRISSVIDLTSFQSLDIWPVVHEYILRQCEYCGRYYETMRRRNYVTPTSYLELIKTFKSLLDHKRMEILTLKNRYIVGLEKLEFSESQVHTVRNSAILVRVINSL